VLERVSLGCHGVLTVAVGDPRRGAPLAAPSGEIDAVLFVQHADAFRAIDLADA